MLPRFRAICLFVLLAALPLPGFADTFNEHFAVTEPAKSLPGFEFQNAAGRSFTMSDFGGGYVLLNLWATWCGPCAREMPALDKLQAQFDTKKLLILALNEERDGIAATSAFNTRHGIVNLPPYNDGTGRAPALFHIRGLPTTILIDPAGREIGRIEGEVEWDSAEVVAFLAAKTGQTPKTETP